MKRNSVFFIAASALLLASCGGSSSEDVIILKVWEDANNHEMLRGVADQFIANYKNAYPEAASIEIEFIEQTEGAAMDDLSLQGPSGNGPDVFAFVHDTLASGVNNELISPVEFSDFVKEKFSEESINAFTFDDLLYAYPITAESQVLMYDNTKLTAEDVVSWERISESGQSIVLDSAGSDSSAYYMFSFMNDVDLFGNGTESNKLKLDTPQAVANLTAMTKDYRNAVQQGTPDQALTIMGLDEAAGVISSPYLWDIFKKELGSKASIAVLPSINGQALRPFSGYKGYSVNTYSKYPMLANALAKHLANGVAQEVRFVQKTLLPTFLDSPTLNDRLGKNEEAVVFQASLEQSLTMPNIVAMGSYWAEMNDAVTEIWNLSNNATNESVEAILTRATQSIKNKIA